MSLSGNDNIAPVTFDEFRAIVDNNAKRYSLPIPEVVSDIAAELGVPADSPAMGILSKKLKVMRSLGTSELMRSYDALPSDRKSYRKRKNVTSSSRPYGAGKNAPVPHSFDEFSSVVDKHAKCYSSTIPEVVSDIAAELGVPADSPAMNILRKKLNQNRSLDSDVLKLIYDKLLSGCKSASHAPPKKASHNYSANSSAAWQNVTSSSHSGGAGRNASVPRSDVEALRLLGWVEVKL